MSKGVLFSISNILSSLIQGIIFAVGLEYLVVNFLFNGLFTFFDFSKVEFSIIYIVVLAIFISQIFSKRSLTNFLFVLGYSRKNINVIKTISTFVIVFISFAITVASFFALSDIDMNIFANMEFIAYIGFIFFVLLLVAELGIYLNILYRKKSVKKAKGLDKKFFRYIYTFIFILCMYSFRIFYNYKIETNILMNINNFHLIALGVSVLLFVILYILNRRNILKLDIK